MKKIVISLKLIEMCLVSAEFSAHPWKIDRRIMEVLAMGLAEGYSVSGNALFLLQL